MCLPFIMQRTANAFYKNVYLLVLKIILLQIKENNFFHQSNYRYKIYLEFCRNGDAVKQPSTIMVQ